MKKFFLGIINNPLDSDSAVSKIGEFVCFLILHIHIKQFFKANIFKNDYLLDS